MLIVFAIAHDSGIGTVINNKTGQVRDLDPKMSGHDVRVVRLPRGIGPEASVTRILTAKSSSEKMDILKLCTHGDAGTVCLPGKDENPLLYLMWHNVGTFASLKDHFHPYQRMIHIHGCGVASDTSVNDHGKIIPGTWKGDGNGPGYRFMKLLATHTRCTVQGNINVEFNSYQRYSGESVIVYPGGGFVKM